jgi:outer membrane protein assembly factor BamB
MPRPWILFACLGLALAQAARADDWPEFRGPTGQGLAKGDTIPTRWSKTKNVVWKKWPAGSGWSSPVVAGGKVYLTSAEAIPGSKDLSLRASCLAAKDGALVWGKEVFRQDAKKAPRIHAKNSHASPTPIVAAGRLYVHFGHQGTACLDLAGKVLWTYRQPYPPVHGAGGSPVLVDDKLVFSTDGASERYVVALNIKDGKPAWRTKRSGSADRNFSFSTPLVITLDGKKQIISPGSGMVGAYDPGTGEEIWRVEYEGYSVIPRPVYGHGLVFIATGYESPAVMAIRPGGKGDVTDTHVKWTTKDAAPNTPSLLLVGEELYMVSDRGIASCLEAKTGKVHWSKRLAEAGYSASPIAAGGNVYFQSENGVGTVVKAGKTFEQVARNDLGERTLASYAVCDGSLFIRTASTLYRIGASGGRKATE